MQDDIVSRRVARFFAGVMIGICVLAGIALGMAVTAGASTGPAAPSVPGLLLAPDTSGE